ncbi:dynamin family protein [Luteimicrobium sp. NPDC057192]|uniref:dynamin family protein n=1 Tax=Luteimicrobium sp. NPDC057192 TaxID=3346042 RepID=UPI003624B11C
MSSDDASAEARLAAAVTASRGALGAATFPFATDDAADARRTRGELLGQLDDYLLPRLRARDAPLLAVVGGSTGAGKSTLVNALVGATVSAPGVLRPTTRAPVLVHHPLDGAWFTSDRVLPGLARLRAGSAAPAAPAGPAADAAVGARTLRLVADDHVPRGLALVDAPDVDSVATENRELAQQLLAAADLWVFVTTAARYADAVPWDLLAAAGRRRAQVALVLDRVDPGAEAVEADLARLAEAEGLGEARIFLVRETPPGDDGLLPARAVAPLARWLTRLAADDEARHGVVDATRDGVVDDLVRRLRGLADAAGTQEAAGAELRRAVDDAYEDAARMLLEATADGSLLRGEVLGRWQELVGGNELFAGFQRAVGRARDRVAAFFRGRSEAVPRLERAIGSSLEGLVLDAAETADQRAAAAWRGTAAGRALLVGGDAAVPPTAHGELRERATAEVRGWQEDVLELVRDRGAAKRGTARALSLGINGAGAVLMVLVFASTAGLTGAELGIAGGTAAASQAVLSAVFGDEAVRQLTRSAREALDTRVRAVLAAEAERYRGVLAALSTPDPAALRTAASDVERAARDERAGREAAGGADGAPAAHAAPAARAGGLRGADLPEEGPDGRTADDEAGEPDEGGRGGFWRRVLRGGRG